MHTDHVGGTGPAGRHRVELVVVQLPQLPMRLDECPLRGRVIGDGPEEAGLISQDGTDGSTQHGCRKRPETIRGQSGSA
jgi:hypothetical protein